jgi:type II secretion system protein G
MQKLLKRQEGFTLLELLIVIVIIGILALIIVPGLASGPKRARDTTRKTDIRALKNALETYYNDNNVYPTGTNVNVSTLTVLVPDYLKTIPNDPKAGQNYTYTSASGTSYTLEATLETPNDPQRKSGTGSGGSGNALYDVSSVN